MAQRHIKELHGCRSQVKLKRFPTGITREEDPKLPVQHVVHVEQLLRMVAHHFSGRLIEVPEAKEDRHQHDEHDQHRSDRDVDGPSSGSDESL